MWVASILQRCLLQLCRDLRRWAGSFFNRDGQDGIHTHLTNTRNTPIEVIERNYPLLVECCGLIADAEGAGQWCGGCGVVRELVCLGERVSVSQGADRRHFTPGGLAGGQNASGAYSYVTAVDGTIRELPTKAFTTLDRDDRLRIETPGAVAGAIRRIEIPRQLCTMWKRAWSAQGRCIFQVMIADLVGLMFRGIPVTVVRWIWDRPMDSAKVVGVGISMGRHVLQPGNACHGACCADCRTSGSRIQRQHDLERTRGQ